MTNRQLPDVIRREAVPLVDISISILQIEIGLCAVKTVVSAAQIGAGRDIQSVAPGIGQIGAETVRKVPAQRDSQAVVVGVSVGKNIKRLCGQERNRPPWIDWTVWVGSRRSLIAGSAVDQMRALATHVSRLDAGTGSNLTLHGQVPFLYVSIGKIRLKPCIAYAGRIESRGDCVCRETIREFIHCGVHSRRTRRVKHGIDVERRIESRTGIAVCADLLGLPENTVRAANDRGLVHLVSKTQAWCEILAMGRIQILPPGTWFHRENETGWQVH